jgi:hypothetical protein
VVVTVAGAGGQVITSDGQTCTHLLAALQAAGEPFVPIRVAPYQPVTFHVALGLDTDPNYDSTKVQASVVSALRAAFSFQARDFGQPVAESQVIAVVQGVPGVIAVALHQLYRSGDTAGRPAGGVLTAALPSAGGDFRTLQVAELLTLDPGPVPMGAL